MDKGAIYKVFSETKKLILDKEKSDYELFQK